MTLEATINITKRMLADWFTAMNRSEREDSLWEFLCNYGQDGRSSVDSVCSGVKEMNVNFCMTHTHVGDSPCPKCQIKKELPSNIEDVFSLITVAVEGRIKYWQETLQDSIDGESVHNASALSYEINGMKHALQKIEDVHSELRKHNR